MAEDEDITLEGLTPPPPAAAEDGDNLIGILADAEPESETESEDTIPAVKGKRPHTAEEWCEGTRTTRLKMSIV